MRAVLRLELIGDNYHAYAKLSREGKIRYPRLRDEIDAIRFGQKRFRPWVARITGTDAHFGLARSFSQPVMNDYSQANAIGSRGIFAWYALESGLYEVNECVALGKARRYFIRVEGTEIAEISKDEVLECLKNDT
jgi:hypothetical protein